MTPEETALVQRLGNNLIIGLAWLITLTLLYGIFILLFTISTAIIIRRGLKAFPQRAMFAVTLVTFLIASVHWAAQLAGATILIRYVMINNPELPFLQRLPVFRAKIYQPNLIILWTTQILPIINDAVVIWRARVLFPQQKWIIIPPMTLWIGLVGTSFAYLGLQVSPAVVTNSASTGLPSTEGHLLTSTFAISIATNISATLLIGYKLWSHRKVVVKNLGLGGRRSQVQNVLIVLVESGVIYCALQTATLILTLVPDSTAGTGSGRIPGLVFFATYVLLSAMYPTIVVVLVNSQRSTADIYELTGVVVTLGDKVHGPGARPATLGHLSFAAPQFHNRTSTERTDGALGTLGAENEQEQEREILTHGGTPVEKEDRTI